MNRQTILIVEDDRNVASCYTALLEDKYEVIISLSGHHAMRLARQSVEIHLAVLDYRLPDISGLEVLREIKKCRPSVPVILVTAHGDEDVAVKTFRCGAKDYIKKPFSYDELLGRIEFCLSLKHADTNPRKAVCPEVHHYSAKIPLKDIASSQHLNIQKALQFVDDNFMTKISLASTAEKACLSRHHFSRAFKKATGVTYQEFVTLRRVEKAKTLLRYPNHTITDIAHSVGYNDINNFIRNFKKLAGLTPTKFRNNLIDSHQGSDK